MTEMFALTGVPWIPYAAKRYLDTITEYKWKVFEYGSGNSTFYFAGRGCTVVSIEDKKSWFNALYAELCECRTINDRVRLIHVPIDPEVLGKDVANPDHYYEPPGEGNYRAYASAIDVYPPGYFDLVVVDGVARPSCLMHAHSKVKPGGYLMLDNSDRAYYLECTEHILARWERYTFWGHGPLNSYQWGCTIWKRPPRRD